MTLWLVRAGRHGEHEQRFLDDSRVYLTRSELNQGLDRVRGVFAFDDDTDMRPLGSRKRDQGNDALPVRRDVASVHRDIARVALGDLHEGRCGTQV